MFIFRFLLRIPCREGANFTLLGYSQGSWPGLSILLLVTSHRYDSFHHPHLVNEYKLRLQSYAHLPKSKFHWTQWNILLNRIALQLILSLTPGPDANNSPTTSGWQEVPHPWCKDKCLPKKHCYATARTRINLEETSAGMEDSNIFTFSSSSLLLLLLC